METHIRWMIRADRGEVQKIEDESYDPSWSQDEFDTVLRRRNVVGMVAERDAQVAGFLIYELSKSDICILNIAVARKFRRKGVGAVFCDKLKAKLHQGKRIRLAASVNENNLTAQLFFKAMKFRAIAVVKRKFGEEDGYLFQYRLPAVAKTGVPELSTFNPYECAGRENGGPK